MYGNLAGTTTPSFSWKQANKQSRTMQDSYKADPHILAEEDGEDVFDVSAVQPHLSRWTKKRLLSIEVVIISENQEQQNEKKKKPYKKGCKLWLDLTSE